MGNCYSTDHIAEDHIHIDVTCNIDEPQQKYCLGTVRNRLLGKGGLKYVLLDPNPHPQLLQWLKTCGPHEWFTWKSSSSSVNQQRQYIK